MEFKTIIDTESRTRRHVIKGPISSEDLSAAMQAFYKSPDFDPGMNSIWDLRDADFRGVDIKTIKAISAIVQGQWGDNFQARAALVVTKDLGFGLSRMYEMGLSESMSRQTRVFRAMDQALAWLKGD